MWKIDSSDEYDAWFLTLDEESKEAILQRGILLGQYGSSLSRPYADVPHGSKKLKNLVEKYEKELENERRNQNDGK